MGKPTEINKHTMTPHGAAAQPARAVSPDPDWRDECIYAKHALDTAYKLPDGSSERTAAEWLSIASGHLVRARMRLDGAK